MEISRHYQQLDNPSLEAEIRVAEQEISEIQAQIANLSRLLVIETAGRVAILKEINNQNID